MANRKKAGCGQMLVGCLGSAVIGVVLLVLFVKFLSDTADENERQAMQVEQEFPTGTEDRLKYEIQKALRTDGTVKVSLENGNLEITITANDVPLTDPSEARFQMEYTDILRGIHKSGFNDFSTVEFLSFVPMFDKFGNKQMLNVSIMNFDKPTLDRINWANFLHVDLTSIASDYSFHQIVKRRDQ